MNYWLTTHWPPRQGQTTDNSPDIWLPDGRESPGAEIARGDLVLIYESRSGRTLLRRKPDASQERVPCQRGREGVVCIGRIRASLTTEADAVPEAYIDGTNIWWRWHAPADVVSRSGFVPRRELASILGYKSSWNFRGFGERHSGLRKLSEEKFNAIVRQFTESQPPSLPASPAPRIPRPAGQSSGESDVHRELKEFVAADPARAINEPGLSTLSIEYYFASGDRADIVLVDRFGRIVAVEIEPEVAISDEAGPLQSIKYRHMLEWSANRVPGDSRALLIAHKIDAVIREKCAKYHVECYEISRETVANNAR